MIGGGQECPPFLYLKPSHCKIGQTFFTSNTKLSWLSSHKADNLVSLIVKSVHLIQQVVNADLA